MLSWRERILEEELNYDEIMHYANSQAALQELGDALCATSTIMEPHEMQKYKTTFLENFEMLNMLLLRYIHGRPELKWCTLPSLLAQYGVGLPPLLQDLITKHVLFPGETKLLQQGPLENKISSNTNGRFDLGYDISLQISQGLNLKNLHNLVQGLVSFLDSILDHIDMLVYFKLCHCEMFEKYLLLALEKETASQSRKRNPMSTLSNFAFSIPKPLVSMQMAEAESDEGVKLSVLLKSLDNTKQLLVKLMEGKATYSEIIAEGNIDLSSLDIEREFDILGGFTTLLHHTLKSRDGLTNVRNMLELFQYTKFIVSIKDVCQQYGLQNCLEDKTLKDIVAIAEELQPEKSRHNLTLIKASEKMEMVKKALFGIKQPRILCLKLFEAIADSAVFYRFIKDKGFTGTRGKAVFTQQYQLITAQLQHEEYDETVLNHLLAAFQFMSPFMNAHQSFRALMNEVISLDTSNRLKQLETVKTNITLIQLWFSRAEVSRLACSTLLYVQVHVRTCIYIHIKVAFRGAGGLLPPLETQVPPLRISK